MNWKRLRAPFCPYFLRSFMRESRVKNPLVRRRRAQFRVVARDRARQSHAHRAGLPADAAAIRGDDHIHLVAQVGELQRLDRVMLPRVIREILFDGSTVHRELAGARSQKHARHRFFAAAGAQKPRVRARNGRTSRTQRSSSIDSTLGLLPTRLRKEPRAEQLNFCATLTPRRAETFPGLAGRID